jgi:hypothetical protein
MQRPHPQDFRGPEALGKSNGDAIDLEQRGQPRHASCVVVAHERDRRQLVPHDGLKQPGWGPFGKQALEVGCRLVPALLRKIPVASA